MPYLSVGCGTFREVLEELRAYPVRYNLINEFAPRMASRVGNVSTLRLLAKSGQALGNVHLCRSVRQCGRTGCESQGLRYFPVGPAALLKAFCEQRNHLTVESRNIVRLPAGDHAVADYYFLVYPCTAGVANIGFQGRP